MQVGFHPRRLPSRIPVLAVSAFLGHTRTSTTTDIYAHLLPGMGREMSALLESVMVKTWSRLMSLIRKA